MKKGYDFMKIGDRVKVISAYDISDNKMKVGDVGTIIELGPPYPYRVRLDRTENSYWFEVSEVAPIANKKHGYKQFFKIQEKIGEEVK